MVHARLACHISNENVNSKHFSNLSHTNCQLHHHLRYHLRFLVQPISSFDVRMGMNQLKQTAHRLRTNRQGTVPHTPFCLRVSIFNRNPSWPSVQWTTGLHDSRPRDKGITISGRRETRTETTPRPPSGLARSLPRTFHSLLTVRLFEQRSHFPVRRTELPQSGHCRQHITTRPSLKNAVLLINHRFDVHNCMRPSDDSKPSISHIEQLSLPSQLPVSILANKTNVHIESNRKNIRHGRHRHQNHQDALSLNPCRRDHRHIHISYSPLLPERRLRFPTPDFFSRYRRRHEHDSECHHDHTHPATIGGPGTR